MSVTFFTIVEGVNAGVDLVENSRKVHSKAKMVYKFIQDGYLRIVIFGPGGVGKTTLGEYLSGSEEYKKPAYIESATDEDFAIGKNVLGKYWVAPGQPRRISAYWPQIYRAISKGKVKGIINVVSYGYHSVYEKINYQDMTDYFETGMSKDQFFSKYLQQKRDEELNIVNEIKSRIMDTDEKINMITVVTKQDLWWKEKNDVLDYYTKGEYNSSIKEIENHKGSSNFQHTYLSLSLLANNFVIGNENFKFVSEGYDENTRIANINAFINQLESFLK